MAIVNNLLAHVYRRAERFERDANDINGPDDTRAAARQAEGASAAAARAHGNPGVTIVRPTYAHGRECRRVMAHRSWCCKNSAKLCGDDSVATVHDASSIRYPRRAIRRPSSK